MMILHFTRYGSRQRNARHLGIMVIEFFRFNATLGQGSVLNDSEGMH